MGEGLYLVAEGEETLENLFPVETVGIVTYLQDCPAALFVQILVQL